jgi:hypothetical protein
MAAAVGMTSWSPTEEKHGTTPKEIRSAMVLATPTNVKNHWNSAYFLFNGCCAGAVLGGECGNDIMVAHKAETWHPS